ncbi:alpha/beta fold hydrolase [Duganella sp. HH101]|uniref:alpha/beta fold hydrolase n=1 Tax=Duganella sp. HH101 TaxID=1781066 RepID=UPI0008745574|nr:alpha/beta hydrolase [Duganella sp. HH101]OFA05153.1 putative aminoacrylate hydrolase RutD [Duganella sp. HH101]
MLTIVLLPGMDGTGNLFAPLIDALKDEFAITVVPYPTHEPLGYSELEAIARRALPTSGQFILLGESFSGPIAISIAASRPEGLVGVVLCCTFVRNPRPVLDAIGRLASRLPIKLAPAALISYTLLGRQASKALRTSLAAAIAAVESRVLQARLRTVLTVDVSAKLKTLQLPVLYMQALEDRVVPASAGHDIATLYPATELLTLHGPHCLLQTAATESAAAIAAFARQSARAASI